MLRGKFGLGITATVLLSATLSIPAAGPALAAGQDIQLTTGGSCAGADKLNLRVRNGGDIEVSITIPSVDPTEVWDLSATQQNYGVVTGGRIGDPISLTPAVLPPLKYDITAGGFVSTGSVARPEDLTVGISYTATRTSPRAATCTNKAFWTDPVGRKDDMSLIFSSYVYGDPATPLFRAYSKDPVRFRVAQAEGDPRSTGFALSGHSWRASPDDPNSPIVSFQGQFNPAVTYNINLDPGVTGGAGGPHGFPGDYVYRSNTLDRLLPGGQWGIMRVFDQPQTDLIQLPDHPISP
jgi:hypothetical protein